MNISVALSFYRRRACGRGKSDLVEFAGHLRILLPQHLTEGQGAGSADGQEAGPRHQQLLPRSP